MDVDYAAAQRLAEKKAAQVAAQKSAMPISERIDDHGQVAVWSIAGEKYVKLWPIDARAQLDSGAVVLDKPYDVASSPVEPDAEPDSIDDPVALELSPEMTVSELRDLARRRGVDISDLKRKDDIYSALELSLSQQAHRG